VVRSGKGSARSEEVSIGAEGLVAAGGVLVVEGSSVEVHRAVVPCGISEDVKILVVSGRAVVEKA